VVSTPCSACCVCACPAPVVGPSATVQLAKSWQYLFVKVCEGFHHLQLGRSSVRLVDCPACCVFLSRSPEA
jgi:hypothetical protein